MRGADARSCCDDVEADDDASVSFRRRPVTVVRQEVVEVMSETRASGRLTDREVCLRQRARPTIVTV